MKKVHGIIIRNGLILLVRKPGMPFWDLPGGTPQKNELEREALVRIIHDKLGFYSTIDELIGIYTRDLREETTYVYKGKEVETQGEIATHEYSSFSFFDIHNLPLNLLPDRRKQIRDFVTGRYPVRLRFRENKLVFRLEKLIREKINKV